MGIVLWLACGVAVFAASRAIEPARPRPYAGELLIILLVSLAAGLTATVLDFGGWGEPDWRAAAFVVCCAFAAAGCWRALLLVRQRAVSR